METWTLSEDAPGRLVDYGRQPYYKPDPLPPARVLELDAELYESLSEATFWLGKLSGISTTVDFSPLLYTSLVRKEAVESAEIEGADVDMDAVYRYETQQPGDETPQVERDVREVLNYEAAIEHGIHELDARGEITMDLIKTLHRILLTDVRSETDTIGEFRKTPVHLGSFVPPAPESVDGLMDSLSTYLRTGGSYHDLVDIALVHYQFETIHPFGDGNGRLGRVLITLQLYAADYLSAPNLYLSEYFNRNKESYVERMRAVSRDGEWERWISFFVDGVRQQAHEAYERSIELRDLNAEYEDRYGESTRTDAQLALKLFEQPYLTASDVQDLLDVTGPTAYRAIHALEDEGVLEETTGRERNREYRATEIFEILEQPPTTY